MVNPNTKQFIIKNKSELLSDILITKSINNITNKSIVIHNTKLNLAPIIPWRRVGFVIWPCSFWCLR